MILPEKEKCHKCGCMYCTCLPWDYYGTDYYLSHFVVDSNFPFPIYENTSFSYDPNVVEVASENAPERPCHRCGHTFSLDANKCPNCGCCDCEG